MENYDAKKLISKYHLGQTTPEESALVEQGFLKDLANNPDTPSPGRIAEADARISAKVMSHVYANAGQNKTVSLWPRIAAAASIFLFLSLGGYFLLHHPKSQRTAQIQQDIAPGRNQATLTLANGQKIILTKGLKGTLAQQGSMLVKVNSGSAIAYTGSGVPGQPDEAVNYNTLSTAMGEQSPYPLILSDGTKVWLNAQSSITFPTLFRRGVRTVKVAGEAYFEVAHNERQPFKVETGTQTIEDIGTSFDVNAYEDERMTRTTLIEGKVKVNGLLLQPGEQTDGSKVRKVNTKKYVAWRNGDFYFEDDDIRTVMRQLSRWYAIDVQYQGAITTEGFNALIIRNKKISSVLHILENTQGVHFKIEGRRVTIMQ